MDSRASRSATFGADPGTVAPAGLGLLLDEPLVLVRRARRGQRGARLRRRPGARQPRGPAGGTQFPGRACSDSALPPSPISPNCKWDLFCCRRRRHTQQTPAPQAANSRAKEAAPTTSHARLEPAAPLSGQSVAVSSSEPSAQ